MAVLNSTPSSFLSLPAELRTMIYVELLTIQGAITLYHDETGREPSLGLCPTILRVSRQVYNESAWLLYDRNCFLLSLTTEVDVGGWTSMHPPRRDRLYSQRADLPTRRQPDLFRIKDDSTGEEQGLIYPHCFRRLRHIGLVTAGDAVRGLKRSKPYFSETYSLIISILECLVAPDGFDWTLGASEPHHAEPEMASTDAGTPPSLGKTFIFVMLRHQNVIRWMYTLSNLEEMDKMANLLAEVERKRDLRTQNMDVCMQGVAQCQAEAKILREERRERMERLRRRR